MYYTKQKGFGPFKRWALMEKVTPRHKEQEIRIKTGLIFTEDGRRPISSANVTIDKDGFIVFEGTGKTSVRAKSFEAYSHGFVFQTPEGTQGYVARNGNVVNPVQKGHTHRDGATITNVDVFGKVIVYQKVSNKDNSIYYTLGDALSGLEVLPGHYTSYSFGKREEGIPGKIIILGNQDGTQTIANDKFAVLSDSATKIQKCDEALYILSNTPNGRFKTVLEAYPISTATTHNPTLKFLENGVIDFDTSFRELITYNGKTSSVYDVSPLAESNMYPKFTKDGVIKNISPIFCGTDIYMQEHDGKKTLLLENGEECKNPELEGFKAIKERYGHSFVVEVDTKKGTKEGLVRSGDLSTLLPPVYDQIRFFGENMFVGTYNDTFLVGKLEEYKKDTYLPPETLLGVNNYFKPQLTNREGVLYAEDSVGMPMVIDFNGRDNKPVAENVVNQASKELGIPLPEKEIEYVE